jgi:DHA1 family solute carrier family 18 vesicular amine transporter 1/2
VTRLTAYVSALVALDLALYSAIVPLLPHLSGELDLSKLQSGLLLGAYSGAVVVSAVPVGHLADRIGTRSVTVAGSLLMAAATAAFAVSDTFALLFAARIAQGLASAIAWSAGLAWLAAAAPAHRRGSAIAIANASATVGMIAGPLLGGAVAGSLGVRETFLGAAAVSLGLAGWGLFERGATPLGSHAGGFVSALRAAGSERMIAISLVVITLVALVGGTLQVLMPLHLGDHGVSQTTLGWLYALGALLGSAAIVTTGRLGDRLGRLPIARVDSLVLCAAVCTLLAPLGTAAFATMLVAIVPIMSVLYGVGYPLGADGADRAGLGHGLVMGLVNLVWGTGAMIGPVMGAAVASRAGDRAAYALLAVLCLTAFALMREPSRRPLEQRA